MKFRNVDSKFALAETTPMISVLFLWLTIFLVAIYFENAKAEDRLRLPVDSLAKPPELRLDQELRLNFGYARRPDGARHDLPVIFHNRETFTIDRIEPLLDREAKRFQAKATKNPNQALLGVTVVIRADLGIPTGMVQELIEKCQAAGFTKFSLQ